MVYFDNFARYSLALLTKENASGETETTYTELMKNLTSDFF